MEDADAVPGYIHDRNWLIYIQKNKSQMLTLGLLISLQLSSFSQLGVFGSPRFSPLLLPSLHVA